MSFNNKTVFFIVLISRNESSLILLFKVRILLFRCRTFFLNIGKAVTFTVIDNSEVVVHFYFYLDPRIKCQNCLSCTTRTILDVVF